MCAMGCLRLPRAGLHGMRLDDKLPTKLGSYTTTTVPFPDPPGT